MVRRHWYELPSQHRIQSEAGQCAGTAPTQRRTRSYEAVAAATGTLWRGECSRSGAARHARPFLRGPRAPPCTAARHLRHAASAVSPPIMTEAKGAHRAGTAPTTVGRGRTAHAPLCSAAARAASPDAAAARRAGTAPTTTGNRHCERLRGKMRRGDHRGTVRCLSCDACPRGETRWAVIGAATDCLRRTGV